ncbi:transcriptional regulator [Listeria seeligeri]|uniref:transcriptional regulator n=1 Tax=Listeria seeligeri TaxID=1640 RepID=UPI0022EA374B|nr:transcriptional regulator [Listeria seeligeri]
MLNGMDELQRLILIRCYIDGKRDMAIALETNYGIAQYKRIKRKSVIELATRVGVVVKKQFDEVS